MRRVSQEAPWLIIVAKEFEIGERGHIIIPILLNFYN